MAVVNLEITGDLTLTDYGHDEGNNGCLVIKTLGCTPNLSVTGNVIINSTVSTSTHYQALYSSSQDSWDGACSMSANYLYASAVHGGIQWYDWMCGSLVSIPNTLAVSTSNGAGIIFSGCGDAYTWWMGNIVGISYGNTGVAIDSAGVTGDVSGYCYSATGVGFYNGYGSVGVWGGSGTGQTGPYGLIGIHGNIIAYADGTPNDTLPIYGFFSPMGNIFGTILGYGPPCANPYTYCSYNSWFGGYSGAKYPWSAGVVIEGVVRIDVPAAYPLVIPYGQNFLFNGSYINIASQAKVENYGYFYSTGNPSYMGSCSVGFYSGARFYNDKIFDNTLGFITFAGGSVTNRFPAIEV